MRGPRKLNDAMTEFLSSAAFVSYFGTGHLRACNHDRHAQWLEIARTYCENHDLDKRVHVRALMRLLADEYSEGKQEA